MLIIIDKFRSLPNAVKGILFFILLTRMTYFMVWPFIAIILSSEYNLSPVEVGLMMTASAYISFMVGVYGGVLSDIYERRIVIVIGCLIAVSAYATLGFASDPVTFSLGLVLVGISYSFIDAPSKAIGSDLLEGTDLREFSLQARYFFVNIAAVSGPLIGLMAGLNAQKFTFYVTAISYIPFAIYAVKHLKTEVHISLCRKINIGINQRMKLVITNTPFLISLLAGFLAFLLFSQIETTLPQYLHLTNSETAIKLITILFSTNAIVVIAVQPFAVHYLERFSTSFKISLGASLFCLAYAMMYAVNSDSIVSWVLIAILYSISEAILMPNVSIQLDKLSSKENRGTFLGVASMVVLGIYTGPLVGGILLESFGKECFLILSLACIAVVAVQSILNNSLTNKGSLEN